MTVRQFLGLALIVAGIAIIAIGVALIATSGGH